MSKYRKLAPGHSSSHQNFRDLKVALVNSFDSPIGYAIAIQLARSQFKVSLVGSNEKEVNRIAGICDQLNGQQLASLPLVLDSSVNSQASSHVMARVINYYGQLNVLINCCPPESFRITDSNQVDSLHIYSEMMRINVDTTVEFCLKAVDHLKRVRGSIVFITDQPYRLPSPKSYAYRMSQAAIASFAKCLALDLTPYVRVNIVNLSSHSSILSKPLNECLCQVDPYEATKDVDQVAQFICQLTTKEAAFTNGTETTIIDGTPVHSASPKPI